ncbi:sigma-70 family RNA polymerase sigma factor [Mariniblastus sp.]|jgi:RNA polymerase sigma factor FliA|nr:sigma-70 family RNA polymerase sigma factor [Mariniblastus sp.]MDB4756287.1 sigma-70 family RNA polymerase sigma factor [Mariniblastus sp.]
MVVKSKHFAARRYKANQAEQDREQLILDNMQFAQKILSSMTPHLPVGVEKENLYSAALLGLTEAAHKFDETRGATFPTFAYPRIRGAIVDELRKNSQLPQKVLRNIRLIREAIEQIAPPATPISIAEATGLTEDQVEESLCAMKVNSPENWDEIGGLSYGTSENPAVHAENKEILAEMADCIELLPDREKTILIMYHLESMLLKEIGAVFHISESRASRILTRAELRLRQLLELKMGGE